MITDLLLRDAVESIDERIQKLNTYTRNTTNATIKFTAPRAAGINKFILLKQLEYFNSKEGLSEKDTLRLIYLQNHGFDFSRSMLPDYSIDNVIVYDFRSFPMTGLNYVAITIDNEMNITKIVNVTDLMELVLSQ